MNFGIDLPSGFRGKDVCTLWMDGQQTPGLGYKLSSPCEPDGSGQLKKIVLNSAEHEI